MYVRVPEDLNEPLMKELKQLRFRASLKYFPALVLIFSSVVILATFVKGHALIEILQQHFQQKVSTTALMVVVVGIIVVITASFLIFFLRQEYNACRCWEYLYCRKCDAADNYDNGHCPICSTPLTERASFYFMSYKEDRKIIERWGLHVCKEA
jgi:hypothetical protein